jgi:hypothetical protein
MSKIKKNIQREKFENTNFEIIYDINYTKQSVTCTLIPKPDFINKLNNRADKVFKGVIGFEVYSQYLLKNIDNKYIVWEFDKSNSFDVEKCKAAAYRSATEYMNNDWHNTTLKMQKLIAAKMLDVSRVYTSYSSTMLKRAADRLKLKSKTNNAEEENVEAAENDSFVDKAKNIAKDLFTK